jgi:ABC-2 type transport system ATP-binding protein
MDTQKGYRIMKQSNGIEIAGLAKAYGKTPVLDGIELSVRAGSVFALLGRNGAGKTTLINILSTLVTPDAGRVTVAGRDLATDADGVRRSISLTGQYAAVDEVLTGEENLRMMGRLVGLSAAQSRRRATELLERFDLVEARGRRVKTYSGGMRRRLDLALSLVVTRPVLFLDEPTTGLDARSRQGLWEIIRGLAASGTTVFLTTQYLEEADQLADRIAVIVDGRIAAEGSSSELKARLGQEVVELRDSGDALLREIPTDGSVEGLLRAIGELGDAVVPGTHVTVRKPSLDDVFLLLTENGGVPAATNDDKTLEVSFS